MRMLTLRRPSSTMLKLLLTDPVYEPLPLMDTVALPMALFLEYARV